MTVRNNHRRKKAITGLCLLVCVVIAILASLGPDNSGVVAPEVLSRVSIAPPASAHIFDQLDPHRELLFSKGSTGDLWFRDASGRERCLASNVVRASFSPDGKKFAYDTKNNEIFVETIEGKQLARLTRACDHAWSSNSAAIIFSATASVDYPELEQTVIYDLGSDPAGTEAPHN